VSRYALLTYQKAGSQWIRDVLFGPRILAAAPGHVAYAPTDQYERLDIWRSKPDGTCGGPFYDVCHEEWSVWSRPQDRAVHVQRDPRDRLISWVFSVTVSHVAAPHINALRVPMNMLDLRDRISLAIGVTGQVAIWMARTWLNQPGLKTYHSTRYERLVENSVAEFGAIFEFFGWEIPNALLRDVIAREAFEVRSGGRPRGVTSEVSHYRRGVAGDWREYFDRALGELFERSYPGALVDLGYETENSWFESLPQTCHRLESAEFRGPGRDPQLLDDLRELRRRNAALESGFSAQRALLEEFEALTTSSPRES
jgi:Sulfotransferase domain